MAKKNRNADEFAAKAQILSKLQQAAEQHACQLIYFDEVSFAASPPVQRGWSPVGQPHGVLPQPHCRRCVLGALDFTTHQLHHQVYKSPIQRPTVVQFLDQLAHRAGPPEQLKVVVLDNAKMHHDIDPNTLHRWLVDHRMVLFYLPAYSPELNLIEILWKHAKYHWRRFVTWTQQTIETEITRLFADYGTKFKISFS